MRIFVKYLLEYYWQINLRSLFYTSLFVAILIGINFTGGIEKRIYALHFPYSLISFVVLYSLVFGISYCFQFIGKSISVIKSRRLFFAYLLMAVMILAIKQIHWQIPFLNSFDYTWKKYWMIVLQLPFKLFFLLAVLFFTWKSHRKKESFFGLTTKNFQAKPYFIILILLIPLAAFAATQHDFLQAYPKVKNIYFVDDQTHSPWLWKLIYEISYSLDFVSVELFFRGFLIIGFVCFAGVDAILPMAALYCTIHFGKPLGECISSFFGGLILGVIAYRTKSIFGGLIVHLGLAWAMECFGYAAS
ncbi:MAG TPA: CPBP family intramembrane glutamic endopeptidase [Puia sp.]|nr:CPBP family intramembrane glutamic endopeptidase [Puia sp.]